MDRTKEALKRLKVSPEELNSSPQITPQLKMAAGGLKAVLRAMRFAADDPDIAIFLAKYDAIPAGDRDRLPWEAIAIAAGVNIKHLLGAIHLALQANSVSAVKIIAVTNHPKIIQARVKFGQLPSGEKDRTALDTAMGFLPSPKGPTFIGKAIFGAGTANSSPASAKDDDDDDSPEPTAIFDNDDFDNLFPPSNAMQEKLVPIRQKLLDK